MLILLTRYKLCAVRIKQIISTSEDVQYKQVNHQVLVQRDTTIQKYIPVDEFLLLIYQVKMGGSLKKNQLNMKYHSKLLVSNICHTEIIVCIRKFTIKHYGWNSLSRNINNNQHI